MNFYRVQYTIDKAHNLVYPDAMSGIVWKRAIYHHEKHEMIGETEEEVKADGKDIIELKPDAAEKLISEFEASYPSDDDTSKPDKVF